MITQIFKQDGNEIRIENAESLDDAAKNNFPVNSYTRYYINGKRVDSYMGLVKYLVSETQASGKKFIPDNEKLQEMKNEMFQRQNSEIKLYISKMRQGGGGAALPAEVEKSIDALIKSIDDRGIRVSE